MKLNRQTMYKRRVVIRCVPLLLSPCILWNNIVLNYMCIFVNLF